MALGFYFAPPSMNAQQYDECIKRLAKAGANHPKGRRYHSCFGTADKLMVFDVWDSQESFDRFGQTLMPILQEIGLDSGTPQVMPIHNVIVPPAARPKSAKPARKAVRKGGRKAAGSKKASRRRGRR